MSTGSDSGVISPEGGGTCFFRLHLHEMISIIILYIVIFNPVVTVIVSSEPLRLYCSLMLYVNRRPLLMAQFCDGLTVGTKLIGSSYSRALWQRVIKAMLYVQCPLKSFRSHIFKFTFYCLIR